MPPRRGTDGAGPQPVDVERLVNRHHRAREKQGAGGEFAVLAAEPWDAPQTVFEQEIPAEDRHLEHRARVAAEFFREKRRLRAGKLRRGVGRVIVPELGLGAGFAVHHADGALVHVRAGTRGDFVVEAREGSFGKRVVAVQEDQVLSARFLDSPVARHGTGARARPLEDSEPAVLRRAFANDPLRRVPRLLHERDAFPVGERLPGQRGEAFARVLLHVAARHDDRKERPRTVPLRRRLPGTVDLRCRHARDSTPAPPALQAPLRATPRLRRV